MNNQIDNNYKSHNVDEVQAAQMNVIRLSCKELAERIEKHVPNSREKSLAFTNLEQVMFWANAGIARNKEEE